jgi:hypothetical protein
MDHFDIIVDIPPGERVREFSEKSEGPYREIQIYKKAMQLQLAEGISWGEAIKRASNEYSRSTKNEFASFCKCLISDGKIAAASGTAALDFLEIFSGIGWFEFSTGENKKKMLPLDAFKAFLNNLPGLYERALCLSKRDGISYRDALYKILQEEG